MFKESEQLSELLSEVFENHKINEKVFERLQKTRKNEEIKEVSDENTVYVGTLKSGMKSGYGKLT